MKRNQILNLEGHFTWFWNDKFFIETPQGCFIWSDPDYNGNNTLTEYSGTYGDFLNECDVEFGRDKGVHVIRDYCGDAVKILTVDQH